MKSLDREDAISFSYVVLDRKYGSQRILREFLPSDPTSRSLVMEFDRVAKQLIQSRPRPLTQVVERFTKDRRFFCLEERISGVPLGEMVSRNGAFSMNDGRSLWKSLLGSLAILHGLMPPFPHGNLTGTTVLVQPGSQQCTFRDPAALLESTQSGRLRMETQLLVQKDLRDAAALTVAAVSGENLDSFLQNAAAINSVLATMTDFTLAVTLDFAINSRQRSGSVAVIEDFSSLAARADAARNSDNPQSALSLLKEAYNVSGSAIVRSVMDMLEEQLKAKARAAVAGASSSTIASPQALGRPPDPPYIPAPTVPTRFCLRCGSAIPANEMACTICSAARPSPPPSVQPPPAPVQEHVPFQPYQEPDATFQPEPFRPPPPPPPAVPIPKKPPLVKILALVAALVVVAGAIWFFMSDSLGLKFDTAIAENRIFAPPGQSAYEVFDQALRERGRNSASVTRMTSKIRPRLQLVSDDSFQRWTNDSDLGETMKWPDLLRVQSFLAEIAPDEPLVRARLEYSQAQVSLIAGRFNEALGHYQSALQAQPNWQLALTGIGKACRNLKRMSCSEEYYQKAIQVNPQSIFPHQNLAGVYMETRRPQQAESEYRAAIQIDPKRPSSHYLLANLLDYTGSKPEACGEYRRFLELNPAGNRYGSEIERANRRIGKLCH